MKAEKLEIPPCDVCGAEGRVFVLQPGNEGYGHCHPFSVGCSHRCGRNTLQYEDVHEPIALWRRWVEASQQTELDGDRERAVLDVGKAIEALIDACSKTP